MIIYKETIKMTRFCKIYCCILTLFLIFITIDAANASNPPEINLENQLYAGQYFSISIPKGWTAQEVYGHEDVQPGQDGFIVFYNNMGRNVDIFSVSFYDPHYPQYNIVVSVKSNVEILKQNNDKSIDTYLLKRYFEQHDFNSFSSHSGPVFIGAQNGFESSLGVSNEQGLYLTYDGDRIDTDNYIYVIERYIYSDFNDEAKERLAEIVNSFQLKSQTLNVSDISPQSVEDYFNRGTTYLNWGDYAKALSDYNEAIELNPNFANAYNARAVLYFDKGDYTKAWPDVEKALELKPNFADAYSSRAALYYLQNNFDQAWIDVNKAIKLDPNLPYSYNTRAYLYAHEGNHDQMLSDFKKALELNPNYEDIYINRGVYYEEIENNLSSAMSDFNKALELKPNDGQSYASRAEVYYKLKEYDKAWADVHKAQSLGYKVSSVLIGDLIWAPGFCNKLYYLFLGLFWLGVGWYVYCRKKKKI